MTELRISNDFADIDLDMIHRFLANESYWAPGVARERVIKSWTNSLCFGAYLDGKPVGFGRVVTDYSSFGYLRDIFVLPQFRGRGYGKQLVAAILERMDEEGVASLMLATKDAQALYRCFGFELVEGSARLMRRTASS
jgi:GNAT superfamily N-acetyltransferase